MIFTDEELSAVLAYTVALRRDFHRHPELSLEEYETAARIEAELDALQIPRRRVGQTGVLGILRGAQDGPAVVLRGDIDALAIREENDVPYRSEREGVMHACGHDAHAACLLGAAKLLAARRETLRGEVRLVFQPGEEIGKGAKPFIDAGVLEGAERVFGLHTAYDVPAGLVGLKPGLNNAGVDFFRVTVHGRSSHVSQPHDGVDALYIACQLVVALQGLATRRVAPTEPLILGVGKLNAGTTYNALAETAVLEGTTRTVTHETRAWLRGEIDKMAAELSGFYGGTAEVFWDDFASPLYNDGAVCAEAAAVADALLGPGHVKTDRALSLSGDNFADFILDTPGAYAYLGTGDPAKPGTVNPNHNGRFDMDEDALQTGAALLAGYALSRLGMGDGHTQGPTEKANVDAVEGKSVSSEHQ